MKPFETFWKTKKKKQTKKTQPTNKHPPKKTKTKKNKTNKTKNKTKKKQKTKQTKQKHVLGLVNYDQSYFVVIQRWTKCGHNDEWYEGP